MTALTLGLLYGAATLFVMFLGVPIAFALGAVATLFMIGFMPKSSVDTITQNVYEEMASITLLSIPLFILKGSAIGRSRAGQDLYGALHAWMHRIPGGLGIANVFACALFAAMAGSSPATCSAIGSAGIPEMRKRGYSPGFAAGIIAAGGTLGILLPPSIVLILYAVRAEQSLGRLFLAGIGPGLLLLTLFAGYSVFRYRHEYRTATAVFAGGGARSAILHEDSFTTRERMLALPRILPFIVLLYISFLPFLQQPSMDAVRTMSFDNYTDLWDGPRVGNMLRNTFFMVVTASTFTVFLSFAISSIIVRSKFKGRRVLDQLAFMPHAIPGIVMGIKRLVWIREATREHSASYTSKNIVYILPSIPM
jgi:TRAP-type uncharacterized transport system fused permease subunit